jgi:hypothetical protein
MSYQESNNKISYQLGHALRVRVTTDSRNLMNNFPSNENEFFEFLQTSFDFRATLIGILFKRTQKLIPGLTPKIILIK